MSLFSDSSDLPFTDITSLGYKDQFAEVAHFLLDVREIVEYVQGRIPGAVNIPLMQLPARLAEIPNDKPVVVVCAHGVRSQMAAEFLTNSGYTDVYNLADGTFGWMLRRLPMES
jgi:rhodanese-related sulfurtransferase